MDNNILTTVYLIIQFNKDKQINIDEDIYKFKFDPDIYVLL